MHRWALVSLNRGKPVECNARWLGLNPLRYHPNPRQLNRSVALDSVDACGSNGHSLSNLQLNNIPLYCFVAYGVAAGLLLLGSTFSLFNKALNSAGSGDSMRILAPLRG